MGRAHNSFRFTQKQLNTRAAITSRQVLEAVLIISEELGKGPAQVWGENVPDSVAINVGWTFTTRTPEELQTPNSEVYFSFVPMLDDKTGDISVTPHLTDNDFPNKKEISKKVPQARDRVQAQLGNITQKVISELRGGSPYV